MIAFLTNLLKAFHQTMGEHENLKFNNKSTIMNFICIYIITNKNFIMNKTFYKQILPTKVRQSFGKLPTLAQSN